MSVDNLEAEKQNGAGVHSICLDSDGAFLIGYNKTYP